MQHEQHAPSTLPVPGGEGLCCCMPDVVFTVAATTTGEASRKNQVNKANTKKNGGEHVEAGGEELGEVDKHGEKSEDEEEGRDDESDQDDTYQDSDSHEASDEDLEQGDQTMPEEAQGKQDEEEMGDEETKSLREEMKKLGLPCSFTANDLTKRRKKDQQRVATHLIRPQTTIYCRDADVTSPMMTTRARASLAALYLRERNYDESCIVWEYLPVVLSAEQQREEEGGEVEKDKEEEKAEEAEAEEAREDVEQPIYGPFTVMQMLSWISAGR
ncbi:hypothetical protein GUITHDRAFT_120123 [Guillardia theta CCMP2712]|uniref:GYF domain-containing protein n=1 Tax=Guillardia theta (strain CCMP2712) TaxID=905079 RepID=L1ICM2_GUITC|nr:hypothetical protein GUITHDRAFT_120123 [Guillardia theta CCMP2712]EKX33674.1 hypothetical protein GUITHDRAFT_120123 [Guillardia theta CCMP2712]|eukprot:XP_005820654.1 hypothetical protein GUITHDRAFT_120123 [Guillardia theta CCMP2712]